MAFSRELKASWWQKCGRGRNTNYWGKAAAGGKWCGGGGC
jgi:hypothetical protein